jgi:hypothetical protein
MNFDGAVDAKSRRQRSRISQKIAISSNNDAIRRECNSVASLRFTVIKGVARADIDPANGAAKS